MSISFVEIKNTLPQLKEHFVGKHINKLIVFCNDTYTFSLGKDEIGYFCLRNTNPFVGYSIDSEHYQSLSDSNIQFLKKELTNSEILDVNLKDNDRILSLKISAINEVFKEEIKYLIFELVPGKANFFILDENKKIIFSLKGCSDGRLTYKGSMYSYPECRPFKIIESKSTINFDTLVADLRVIRKKEKYQKLFKFISSKLKISKNKIEEINEDLEKAKKHLNDFEIGELILMNLDKIKFKDKSILIDNISIQLNPRLKPYENANWYFKQSKKAKATISQSNANLERAINEQISYEHISNLLESSSEQELESIIEEFELSHILDKPSKSSGTALISSSLRPYFFIYDDTTVLFGKSAKQNDYLTFLVDTSKKHTWMHILGYSGAHLMICSDSPSQELINLCAQLLCYASKQVDGEVMLTKREHVKKGQNPGQVSVSEYKTIRVNNVSKEAIDLFYNAKRK